MNWRKFFMPLHWRNFELQDPVLLCVLLYFLLLRDYNGFLRMSLLASCLHDGGHIAAYWCFFRRMPVIYVNATGFCMKTKGCVLPPQKLCVLAAAGPCVNFALATMCACLLQIQMRVGVAAFFAANFLLGCFNLLPIPPLDGAVILESFWQIRRRKLHFRAK